MKPKNFQMPRSVQIDEETLTDTFGQFTIQPLERGFGTTIGNVLNSLESFTNIYDYFAMQIVPGQLSEFADSADVDAFLATELTESPRFCGTDQPAASRRLVYRS